MTAVWTRLVRRRWPLGAAFVACLIFLAVIRLWPEATVDRWREAATDRILTAMPLPVSGRVTVIDIDDTSLEGIGAWPWPRETLSRLVGEVAGAGAEVIGLDMLFSGRDRMSPKSLAQQLAADSGLDSLAQELANLPEADSIFAEMLDRHQTVLGFLLADQGDGELTSIDLLLAGPPPDLEPWIARATLVPLTELQRGAADLGTISLMEGDDGRVRSVPLLVIAGEGVYAGFAATVLKLAEQASSFIITADAAHFQIGPNRLPLARTADLRFLPSPPEVWEKRTLPAYLFLRPGEPRPDLSGQIVLIGGGSPALGAIRATAASPVAPSVQIQADAIETMLGPLQPVRPDAADHIDLIAGITLAALLAGLGAFLSPLLAAAIGIVAAGAWVAGAVAFSFQTGLLFDPVTPALAGLLALMTSGTVAAVDTRRAARLVRRRFEQHLAPSVVARIVENPSLLRLEGERRDITALFTDIENFTAVTEAIGPVELVRLLDGYFAGVTAAITRHGGMVDKIVGDAVHALFNAPVDLADHPRAALKAASDILVFSKDYASRRDVAASGLGRTRIGIETGEAVVGDVGAGAKLDYTAHGNAVNMAARLEAANKELGTSVCVGPECRARLPDMDFRALGSINIRGRGAIDVFEPLDLKTSGSSAEDR